VEFAKGKLQGKQPNSISLWTEQEMSHIICTDLHRRFPLNTFNLGQFMDIKCKAIPVLNSASRKMFEEVEEELHVPNFRTRRRWVVSFVPSHQGQSENCNFVIPGMVHPSGYRNRGTNVKTFKVYWSCDAPTGLTFNTCMLCPHCIYVFCIYLRTNSDLCHLQHKLIGFYNRDEKCLPRGTDWVFK